MIIMSKKYRFEITAEIKDDEEVGLAGVDSFQMLYFLEEFNWYIAINNYGFICGPANTYSHTDSVEKECVN